MRSVESLFLCSKPEKLGAALCANRTPRLRRSGCSTGTARSRDKTGCINLILLQKRSPSIALRSDTRFWLRDLSFLC